MMTLSNIDYTKGKIENTDGNKYGKPLGLANASCEALGKTNCFSVSPVVNAGPIINPTIAPNDVPAVPIMPNAPIMGSTPVAVTPAKASIITTQSVPVVPVMPAPIIQNPIPTVPVVQDNPISMVPEAPVAAPSTPTVPTFAVPTQEANELPNNNLPNELPVAPVIGNAIDPMAGFVPLTPVDAPVLSEPETVASALAETTPAELTQETAALEPVEGEIKEELFDPASASEEQPVDDKTQKVIPPVNEGAISEIDVIFDNLSKEMSALIEETKKQVKESLSNQSIIDNNAINNTLNQGIDNVLSAANNTIIQTALDTVPTTINQVNTEIPQMQASQPFSM